MTKRGETARGRLWDRVAIVELTGSSSPGAVLAVRLAAEGATVVLVGSDAAAAGAVLAAVEAGGAGRGAYFSSEGRPVDLDALVEFVDEQFRDRPPPEAAPAAS